jgi:preprotein translocase subunit SecF
MNFKFSVIKQRALWWAISAIIIAAGLVAMAISMGRPDIKAPLRLGLDFSGGTRIEMELACVPNCPKPIDIADVRAVMSSENLANSGIQILDNYGVTIRSQALDVVQRTRIQDKLTAKLGKFNPAKTQIDTVGPTLGRQLLSSALLALLLSFAGIAIYLSFRFQIDFAVLAVVALVHDVLVTTGVFSILGLVANVEVDSLFVVALLTIIGFSVNDTVVIYDRVRENLKLSPNDSISDVVDASVLQTLSRSINTTFTTLLSLVAIFLFGGDTLKTFSLALIVGFAMGAYSSIFIASTLLAWWRERQGNRPLSPAAGSPSPTPGEG